MNGLSGEWGGALDAVHGPSLFSLLPTEREKSPACNAEGSFYHFIINVRVLCPRGGINTIDYLQSILEVSSEINILMQIYDIVGG